MYPGILLAGIARGSYYLHIQGNMLFQLRNVQEATYTYVLHYVYMEDNVLYQSESLSLLVS